MFLFLIWKFYCFFSGILKLIILFKRVWYIIFCLYWFLRFGRFFKVWDWFFFRVRVLLIIWIFFSVRGLRNFFGVWFLCWFSFLEIEEFYEVLLFLKSECGKGVWGFLWVRFRIYCSLRIIEVFIFLRGLWGVRSFEGWGGVGGWGDGFF